MFRGVSFFNRKNYLTHSSKDYLRLPDLCKGSGGFKELRVKTPFLFWQRKVSVCDELRCEDCSLYTPKGEGRDGDCSLRRNL